MKKTWKVSIKVFKRDYLLNDLFSEKKIGFKSSCPVGLFYFISLLERLLHPLDHSVLPCESSAFFSLCLVCGRLSFPLSKNDEHLIRSLEHVGKSRSRETSQQLGKPQETCGRMGLWLGRGLSWAVQAVWSEQAQRRPTGSHLLSLPRLGFLGSRPTLKFVYREYVC